MVITMPYLTGPCSRNDSGYVGKLEISKIKKPSCFVKLIPRYIQEITYSQSTQQCTSIIIASIHPFHNFLTFAESLS